MEGRPMSQRKIAVFWLRWFLQDPENSKIVPFMKVLDFNPESLMLFPQKR
jgi:hypothetical protein